MQSLREFIQTLDETVSWLHETWPNCVSTQVALKDIDRMFEDQDLAELTITEWHQVVGPYTWALEEGDLEEFKDLDHDTFRNLKIHEKYFDPQATPKAKQWITSQLLKLNRLAQQYSESVDIKK